MGAILSAGLRVGENISYYILTVFSLTYLVDVAAETRELALRALLIGAAVQFFAIPLFAWLSDRIGRRPVYAFGGLGLAAWSFVIASKIAWQWPIYGTLFASIVAVALSVRFGGRIDDIKVSRGTSRGQHLH